MIVNVKRLAMLATLLVGASALHAVQPVPKTLTQEKLDRFIQEYETVAANEVVSSAWDAAFQAAAMEELMNPNSTLTTADALTAVLTLTIQARAKAKLDAAATGELKKMGWSAEYWDVYAVMQICIHFSSLNSFNAQIAQEGYEVQEGDEKIPPIENFVSGADYQLVWANFDRIMGIMEADMNAANGFGGQ